MPGQETKITAYSFNIEYFFSRSMHKKRKATSLAQWNKNFITLVKSLKCSREFFEEEKVYYTYAT
jgi:hypothetical protein